MMRVPYTYYEIESIESDYDEQVPVKIIAENINRDFHNGEPIRTVNSVNYVISKLNSDDGWKGKLEEIELNKVKWKCNKSWNLFHFILVF